MELFDPSEPKAKNALIFSQTQSDGDSVAELLAKTGCRTKVVTDIRNAKKYVKGNDYDLIVSIISGRNCYGMEFLKWLQDTVFGIRRIGITKEETVTMINEVYRLGANLCFYFHSIERDILAEHLEFIFNDDGTTKWYQRRSRTFMECGERIMLEAKSRENLLITGERGTGKCSIARLIHSHSDLRNGKFVVADCSSFCNVEQAYERIVGSDNLTKCAIYRSQSGLLAQSNGGTLLVDHVEKLPEPLQNMFVSILERGVYYEVSQKKEVPFNGRIIFSATNLEDMVMEGTFSSRLYHVMRQSVLRIPSLSECPEDILPLTEAFIVDKCARLNRDVPKLTKGAKEKLQKYVWPDNVRELFSTISTACTVFRGNTIGEDDIELLEPVDTQYRHSDKYRLKKALQQTHGNVSAAAKIIGKDRTTAIRWMKDFGYKREDFK